MERRMEHRIERWEVFHCKIFIRNLSVENLNLPLKACSIREPGYRSVYRPARPRKHSYKFISIGHLFGSRRLIKFFGPLLCCSADCAAISDALNNVQ